MGFSIGRITCITVDGQRQFYGHLTADGVGHITGTSRQMVRHQRTDVDVVTVVILAVF